MMNDVMSNLVTILIVVAVCALIYFLTKWLETQKFVKEHQALEQILDFINSVSLSIAQQVVTTPVSEDKEKFKNDLTQQAILQIRNSMSDQIKRTNLNDEAVKNLILSQVSEKCSTMSPGK